MRYDFSEVFRDEIREEGGKIILCVLDGLGGIPDERRGWKTELEFAKTPNLDKIAPLSSKGVHIPVEFGITPGSGPSHLALFGYDPVKNVIKRGIMEALGIGLTPGKDEVVARGNFAKAKEEGGKIKVIDRRAGRITTEVNRKFPIDLLNFYSFSRRITTEVNRELVSILSDNIKEIDGVEIKFYTVKEHRVCISFKGDVSDDVSDTDPGRDSEFIKEAYSQGSEGGKKLAKVVNKLTRKIFDILKDNEFAQCILMRGFSGTPDIQSFQEKWKLRALAIASYPMYRGIAKILGMDVAELKDGTLDEQVEVLKKSYEGYDFFYFHFKKTDSAGEDGNFDMKVKAIEEFDSILPQILSLEPDVLAITGDHSTPTAMAYHSFHPVPSLVYSRRAFRDGSGRFTERDCMRGSLGVFYAVSFMPFLLACAGRLEKFGA